jgi:hypothetical protein
VTVCHFRQQKNIVFSLCDQKGRWSRYHTYLLEQLEFKKLRSVYRIIISSVNIKDVGSPTPSFFNPRPNISSSAFHF